jgi:hypothetical protein
VSGAALAGRVVAALAVVVTLVLGTWFWAGVVAPGYWSSIVMGTGWFVAVSLVAGRLTQHRPAIRRWTRTTFAVCAVASVAGFLWTSVRTTTVDETVITGVPASQAGQGPTADPDDAPVLDPDDH